MVATSLFACGSANGSDSVVTPEWTPLNSNEAHAGDLSQMRERLPIRAFVSFSKTGFLSGRDNRVVLKQSFYSATRCS